MPPTPIRQALQQVGAQLHVIAQQGVGALAVSDVDTVQFSVDNLDHTATNDEAIEVAAVWRLLGGTGVPSARDVGEVAAAMGPAVVARDLSANEALAQQLAQFQERSGHVQSGGLPDTTAWALDDAVERVLQALRIALLALGAEGAKIAKARVIGL